MDSTIQQPRTGISTEGALYAIFNAGEYVYDTSGDEYTETSDEDIESDRYDRSSSNEDDISSGEELEVVVKSEPIPDPEIGEEMEADVKSEPIPDPEIGEMEVVVKSEPIPDPEIGEELESEPIPDHEVENRWQMSDLEWNRANHKLPPLAHAFRGNAGIQVDVTNFRPVDFFELFVNEDLINHFVLQTNLMAAQFIENSPKSPRFSNVRSWLDTNVAEMRLFLGLLFLMGLDKKPKIPNYWSVNPLYYTPLFSAVMTRNRFQLLLKFWHFSDNTQAPQRNDPNRDKLYKLRPLLDHLFELFQTVYVPTQDVCIDKSVLLRKGKLLSRHEVSLKRAKCGIKMYSLYESTGYTYRFKLYTGEDGPVNNLDALLPDDVRDFSMTEKTVLHMALPLLDQGYSLWVDDWHTSARLFAYLHLRSTNVCGTIREDRVPVQFRKDMVPVNETVSYRCGPLLCLRFHDKEIVSILTTMHSEKTEQVNARRRGRYRTQPTCKPVAFVQYKTNMSVVEIHDKLIQPYSAVRKTIKWYKKLAIHLLQISMLNAHILYKKASTDNKLTFQEFQESVISSLLLDGNLEARPLNQPSQVLTRLTGRHFLGTLKPTATWTKPQARCRVCSKHGKRRDVKTICITCEEKPGLCIDCFRLYHTVLKY